MSNPSFFDNVRGFIGGIVWHIFLWANRMTNDEYHMLYKLSVLSELPQVCEHGYNGICSICDATQTPPRKE